MAEPDPTVGGEGAVGERPVGSIAAILPTYNRASMLPRAIDSALAAKVPAGCRVQVVVVDNNSKDDTRDVVGRYIARFGADRVAYLFEPRQGRQFALNRGIADSSSEIVAMFDDDEVLDETWFEVIAACFADPGTDFIGGPYKPDWSMTPPDWVPQQGYGGVLGIIDNGPVRRRYGAPGFDAMLAGGNSAIRRSMLERTGPYSDGYMYAEDRYMYAQLLRHGAVGYYIPDLIIYHHIPEKRLRKSYFRHWALTEGGNHGSIARDEGTVRRLLRAPPWRWRRAAEAAARLGLGYVTGRTDDPRHFRAELDVIQFFGFMRGSFARPSDTQRFDRS